MHRWQPVITVLFLGCLSAPQPAPWPDNCGPNAPAGAVPVAFDSVPQLAGHWEIVAVSLSHGPAPRYRRGTLDLKESDPASRVARGPMTWASGVWVGHLHWQDAPGADSIRAEVDGTTLNVGCIKNCMDGIREAYRLLAVAGDRMWGLWENPQDGGVGIYDEHDRELPNPAGYFCAKRIDNQHRQISGAFRGPHNVMRFSVAEAESRSPLAASPP